MSSSSANIGSWFKGFNSGAKVNYTRMGRKNKTSYPEFIKLCKFGKKELKDHLRNWLKNNYTEVINGDGFLYARGEVPVLITAHMDTVHKEKVKDFYEFVDKANNNRHIISSPQGIGGDDRCGVYMIKQIVANGLKPYILFCEDEEIGGVGSGKFCKTNYVKELEKMLFLIELDRKGSNDLVYYEDDNTDFHNFCEMTIDYEENWGSFSDISNLSPACDVSSVNISCGYYNAHTTDEYVVMEEMENSIKATITLINSGVTDAIQYKYIVYRRPCRYGLYGDSWYDYYDRTSWYDDYTPSLSKTSEEKESTKENTFKMYSSYVFYDYDGTEYTSVGRSVEEAIGNLLIDNSLLSWGDISDYWEIGGEDDPYAYSNSSDYEYTGTETVMENDTETEEETICNLINEDNDSETAEDEDDDWDCNSYKKEVDDTRDSLMDILSEVAKCTSYAV